MSHERGKYIVIRIERKIGLAICALLVVATAVGLLNSETMTMTTYYPSPSGIYKRLVSTSDSVFARDSGNVGIGAASPAAKLHVIGNSQVVGRLDVTGNLAVGKIGAAVGLDASAKTDALRLPSGTTPQRPILPVNGDLRFNSTTNQIEAYVNGVWTNLGGGTASSPPGTLCGLNGSGFASGGVNCLGHSPPSCPTGYTAHTIDMNVPDETRESSTSHGGGISFCIKN
ncbi:MAG: hypothetical protein HY078_06580 [Elusimicrobia bacterium]|nr:hypothetical protein [Elusimicrobiota bacterium]